MELGKAVKRQDCAADGKDFKARGIEQLPPRRGRSGGTATTAMTRIPSRQLDPQEAGGHEDGGGGHDLAAVPDAEVEALGVVAIVPRPLGQLPAAVQAPHVPQDELVRVLHDIVEREPELREHGQLEVPHPVRPLGVPAAAELERQALQLPAPLVQVLEDAHELHQLHPAAAVGPDFLDLGRQEQRRHGHGEGVPRPEGDAVEVAVQQDLAGGRAHRREPQQDVRLLDQLAPVDAVQALHVHVDPIAPRRARVQHRSRKDQVLARHGKIRGERRRGPKREGEATKKSGAEHHGLLKLKMR